MILKRIQVISETICKYLFSENWLGVYSWQRAQSQVKSFDIDETKPLYWNEASLIGNLRPPLSFN